MAVIQDLPAELLIRILELCVEGENPSTGFSRLRTRSSLSSTALVARSWRAPSQALLSSRFETHSANKAWARYLDELSKPSGTCLKRMRRLELAGSHFCKGRSPAEQLALLAEKHVLLEELSTYGKAFTLSRAHWPLLQGGFFGQGASSDSVGD